MTDANTAPPPRLVFALFGRRRSGKSVLMAALRAVRRPQVDGVRISYVGALPAIHRDNTESQDDSERKRIEAAYADASDALSDGRVPSQTPLTDGIMGHRFELTLPMPPAPRASVRLHVDIYDYAGELLAISQDDQKAVSTLHSVLRDTDGLLILAETPFKGVDAAAHRESLSGVSALGEALARLGAKDSGELRHAVLLATKWDHQHPFICERAPQEAITTYLQRLASEEERHAALFAEWLATDSAAEQHHQLDGRLRSVFGAEEYRAYPVSAFGLARFVDIGAVDGSQAEVPALVPLSSLNLDEPILFLVERARARRRRDLMARAAGPDEAIGRLPDRAAVIAMHGEDAELLALRDDLAARQENAAAQARRQLTRRTIGLGALCAATLAGGGIWLDASTTLRAETEAQALVKTALTRNQLEAVITARDALFDLETQRPLLPTVRLLGLGYAPQQKEADLTSLTVAECNLWADRAGQPDFDQTLGQARLRTLAGCTSLNGAMQNAHMQNWKYALNTEMDAFDRLTDPKTCSMPDFVPAAVSDKKNAIFAHLDKAPAEAVDEVISAREDVSKREASCNQARTEAETDRQMVKERKAREAELAKLDKATLSAAKWADYVKGLNGFMDMEGRTTPGDLEKRKQEGKHRLELLPGALEAWFATIRQDEPFNKDRSKALDDLEAAVNALPAEFKDQKTKITKTVSTLLTESQVWGACTAFKDVQTIYQDISGNLSARTDERIQELRDAVARLGTDQNNRDHLSDALDKIDSQIATISEVGIYGVTLAGQLPAGSDTDMVMTWDFGKTGTMQITAGESGNINTQFRLGRSLSTTPDELFVKFTDVDVVFDDYYALKLTVPLDTLLVGKSGLEVSSTLNGTIYGTYGEGTSSNFEAVKNPSINSSVRVTIALKGKEGPAITPAKCAAASSDGH